MEKSKSKPKHRKSGEILVTDKKLGRERAAGQAWQGENLIEIDPRQSHKDYMDTLIHESLHIFFPDWSEYKVKTTAKKIAAVLWDENYRKVNL